MKLLSNAMKFTSNTNKAAYDNNSRYTNKSDNKSTY